MRSLLLFIILAITGLQLQAQCTISGPSTLAAGQSGTYSIAALAQCTECYDWDVVTGDIYISGTDQQNSVVIVANSAGLATIRVTWFDEDGCHQCTFKIFPPPCDVTQDGIYFLNALGDGNLKFYTMPNLVTGGPNSFSYYWIFTYADLSTSWSYDREPYIPVPCNNPIIHAYVKVSSDNCFKEFNKDYPGVGICGTEGMFGRSAQLANSITVSPNPTTSRVTFSGKGLEKYTIAVFDHMGNAVIKKASMTTSLDLSKYKNDVYLYIITAPDGSTQKGKIIKQ